MNRYANANVNGEFQYFKQLISMLNKVTINYYYYYYFRRKPCHIIYPSDWVLVHVHLIQLPYLYSTDELKSIK